ncbi:GNAT family N-acetyltransferase [Geomesophilobacter sediminis]|uniref:GNAT family N-acetyltransferase n=1 Tax=Geomesophilobacter sediminis TaxID=2798584 RepID=A0A8J7M0I4_9BACT|nr:GNAT family N-acetyltransferase [Geomesophilobacter sediminis]MBJ6725352.1 GNAT family N-acetyltransferase [Geomesophilobacter sediminis]
MASVIEIDPLVDPRWDALVESHPFGWITHLSGWKRVLDDSFPHLKGHYLALEEPSGVLVAGLPVFQTWSLFGGRQLVSLPQATLCDPLVRSEEELAPLLAALRALAERLNCSGAELRTLTAAPLFSDPTLDERRRFRYHYLMLRADPEELMPAFHRSCVRQRIARAVEAGVTARPGTGVGDLELFYRLYLGARKRIGLLPQPYRFFAALWSEFHPSGLVTLTMADYAGAPVAALLLFRYGKRVSAEVSVGDEAYRGVSPNHLLFWEAIRAACREGYEVFDFGRTPVEHKSLLDAKNRWGTLSHDLCHYHYQRSGTSERDGKEVLRSVALLRKAVPTLPRFAFRMAGNFCYRHLV